MLSYIWLSQSHSFGDEAFLVKWSALIKKDLLKLDPKPLPADVLLINTAKSKAIIEVPPDELQLASRREVITDRKLLTQLVANIHANSDSIGLLVFDILFDQQSNDDSLFQQAINTLPKNKILGVDFISESGELSNSVIDLPTAIGAYQSPINLFFKYPLAINGYKTLPTSIYEIYNHREITKVNFFFWEKSKLCFPLPITDFKVRNVDFGIGKSLQDQNFTIFELNDLLALMDILDAKGKKSLFQNKLILVGDFDTDLHTTPFGIMPGILIVLNAYLTLDFGEHIISFWWIIFVITMFAIISYRIFKDKQVQVPERFIKDINSPILVYLINSLDEIFVLTVMTFVSFLLFNIHINILFLFIYLKVLEFALRRFNL